MSHPTYHGPLLTPKLFQLTISFAVQLLRSPWTMDSEIHYEGWLIKSPPTKRIWRAVRVTSAAAGATKINPRRPYSATPP